MKFSKAVKAIILPFLDDNGFCVLDTAPGYFEFCNNDDTLRIVIDIHPYPPPYIRVCCLFRRHIGFSNFDLEQLNPNLDGAFFYKSQIELEEKLALVKHELQVNAIPLLKHLYVTQVFAEKRLFSLLSVHPMKQAKDFANRYSISLSYERSNFIFLENQIIKLRGDVDSDRRITFEANLPEIASLIAYYGEILRNEDSSRSKWKWDNNGIFGIWYTKDYWLFPHTKFIKFWNYNPYISVYRLLPITMK